MVSVCLGKEAEFQTEPPRMLGPILLRCIYNKVMGALPLNTAPEMALVTIYYNQ